MGSEYNRVQVIMLEQLHRTFEHDTAHLSRDEQISLAIAAAQSFNDAASDLLTERRRPTQETRARNIEHTAAHDCACDECVRAERCPTTGQPHQPGNACIYCHIGNLALNRGPAL